jgi:hypothetical protein
MKFICAWPSMSNTLSEVVNIGTFYVNSTGGDSIEFAIEEKIQSILMEGILEAVASINIGGVSIYLLLFGLWCLLMCIFVGDKFYGGMCFECLRCKLILYRLKIFVTSINIIMHVFVYSTQLFAISEIQKKVKFIHFTYQKIRCQLQPRHQPILLLIAP